MDDLLEWAEGLIARVDGKWKSVRDRDPLLSAGFAVFYSPPRHRPVLMIVGQNPGGGSGDFDHAGATRLPEEHAYLVEDYPIARRVRSLFSFGGGREILAESIKSNLNFFRSRDTREWNRLPLAIRRDLEEFCGQAMREMLARIEPRFVLAEGLDTYRRLKRLGRADGPEEQFVSAGRVLLSRTRLSGATLLGVIHPSGARVATADWDSLRDRLRDELRG